MSHASPAGSARAQARALGSRGWQFAGGPAGHMLSPPTIPRPFRPTRRGCQGTAAGSGEWCDEGENQGVMFGIFPSCRVFQQSLPIRFGGSTHPCPPGEGSGPQVWSGQGVWGADLLLIVVLGGSFLPGEGSLLSQLTFFPLPVVSARGEGSGTFYIFDPPTRTPQDAPSEIFQDFFFCRFSSEISMFLFT